MLGLVSNAKHIICHRPTCNKNAGTVWDNATAYVNIILSPTHCLSQALITGLPANLS